MGTSRVGGHRVTSGAAAAARAETMPASELLAPIVVMGVQGSGKSTVGRALSDRIGAAFVDADDLHPMANRRKMAGGVPLDDDDRTPWLHRVGEHLAEASAAGAPLVVACSALKRRYRDLLRSHVSQTLFVHLVASRSVLASRIAGRSHEFMPVSLLDTQLADLEPLGDDERAIEIDVDRPLGEIVDLLVAALADAGDEAGSATFGLHRIG